MRNTHWWKVGLIGAVTALCVFFYFYDVRKGVFAPKGALKLGLDLRGGIHLVLLMDPAPSIKGRVISDLGVLETELRKRNQPFSSVYRPGNMPTSIVAQGADGKLGVAVSEIGDKSLTSYTFASMGEGKYGLTLKDSVRREIEDNAIAQSVEVIRNRIDKYGVAEPVIHRQGMGSNKIVVELPGVEDPTEVKRLIGKAALLEWRLEVEPVGGLGSRQAVVDFFKGQIPADVEIIQGSPEKYSGERWFALKSSGPVSGADIQEVRVGSDNFGRPVVDFQLTPAAGRKFKTFTGSNIQNRLAIVLDGVVITDPVINAEIDDKGIIEGNFSQREAKDLVFQLKSGALPAIPTFGEERTVGPSLGITSIRKGTLSGLIGLIAIFAFMLLYYRLSGINACFTLLLNFVLLMGIMSIFGATLTVPGIAGIILTLGMAIDANVLIFERIKDEIIENKAIKAAISGGFSKAFITIFDNHVTNWVSALFLLQFGTGPVRGFAVTLTVGLLINMFTAVFVSRVIYDIVMDLRTKNGVPPTNISIGPVSSFRGTKVPFMKYKVHFMVASFLIIGIGMASLLTRGLNWGIDFRGGQEIQVRFAQKTDPRSVENALKSSIVGAVTAVQYGKPEENEVLIRLDAKDKEGRKLDEKALAERNDVLLRTLRTPEIQQAVTAGKLDLNTTDTRKIEANILDAFHSGKLSGTDEQGKALALAIMEARKAAGGVLPNVEALKKVPGMSDAMYSYLSGEFVVGNFALQRVDTVGPTVGKELKDKAIFAVIGSLVGILLYAWFRFQFRFSVGAVLSLVHDALMALGFLSLFQVEVNLPTIAALLTLLGYSISDTIVVFDRIREHMRKTRKQEDDELFDRAINETISRTMITSLLTFFVVVSMLIFGGEVLFSFSFVMTVGIVVGTYSSIFVASPYVLWWNQLGMSRLFSKGGKKR
jgi:preprotein translocase subunit SecD